MNLALLQAHRSLGNTKRSPSVGCVITRNNNMIAAGTTGLKGVPHAEFNALKFCKQNLKNSNLYSTLEPCSHYGKTPPCVKAIAKSKVKNVFFSINDPDTRSYDKCKNYLSKKKINVKQGLFKEKVKIFYKSYIKYKENTLPFITCKIALSKDFFTINKKSKFITNIYSRGRVHLMRSYHDCIITSSKTIIKDNPKLTCRINGLENRTPSRIILDNKLKLPVSSKVIKDANKYPTIIFYNKASNRKIKLMKKLKVKLYKIPLNAYGMINLQLALIKAKQLGYSRIFLESGIKLIFSFLNEDLIDDLKIFVSNKNIGKSGLGNFRKYYYMFLKKKNYVNEDVNLFGEKLLSFKLK